MKQLLRILWGFRLTILIATVSCMLGGLYVLRSATPVYRATSRVALEVVKPDPVTGAFVPSKQLDAYMNSQVRLITDVQVASRAAGLLGWADDPSLQSAYALRPQSDERTFPQWIAATVLPSISAAPLRGTNILEISFRSSQPDLAAAGAEAVRSAYIDVTVTNVQDGARAEAERLEAEATRVQALLLQAEAERSALERETGVILTNTGADLTSAGLSSLTGNQTISRLSRTQPKLQMANPQIAQLDAAIAAAMAAFGPNHPDLQSLIQRRAILAAQLSGPGGAGGVVTENPQVQAMVAQALGGQMERIISQRPDVSRVRILFDEAGVLRAQHKALLERSAVSREMSRITAGNVTPLGKVNVPETQDSPKRAVILGGTLVLGGVLGGLVALLGEFLNRRVRSAWDLGQAIPAPMILSLPKARRFRSRSNERPRALSAQ